MSANIFEQEEDRDLAIDDSDEKILENATQLQLFLGSDAEDEDNQQIYFSDENVEPTGGSANRDNEVHDDESNSESDLDNPIEDFGFASDEEYDIDDEELINDSQGFKNAIRAASNFRQKGTKKKGSAALMRRKLLKSKDRELDPEVRILLSQANEAFVRNDFQVALNLYSEVVRKDPKNFSAYKTLGEIYKQQGKLHDCCNYWFLAANIHPWDNKFWSTVAELSSELGHTTQAVYCYGRAIVASNNHDLKAIFDRAVLYRELKQYGRALESFQKLHQLLPEDTLVVKELAMVYVLQNRTNDAIDMYMRILDDNMNNKTESKENIAVFTWSELNILAELYDKQKSWEMGIKIIKVVARWLQNRINESWWDETSDDSEFDERRSKNVNFEKLSPSVKSKPRNLPIDIRVKLGFFRLALKEKDEAMIHFKFLFTQNINEIADLHLEVGKALEEVGDYEDALKFLEPLSYTEQFNTQELVLLLAKCLQEIGDYSQAENAYSSILQVDPNNLDIKLALAEVLYHLGDIGRSQILLRSVTQSRKANNLVDNDNDDNENENDNDLPDDNDNAMDIDTTQPVEDAPMIINKKVKVNKRSSRLTDEQREEMEKIATKKVLEKYNRMKKLEKAIEDEDLVGISAWTQLASQLVEMFMNIKNFSHSNKSFFQGKKKNIDEKINYIYNLYNGINTNNDSKAIVTSKNEFRGITFDEWFVLFMKYAIITSKFQDGDYGLSIIDAASNINVFTQNKERESIIRMVKISIGVTLPDFAETVGPTIRVFLNAYQFSPLVYKLFMFCLPSGKSAIESFASFNHQKFFLRQIKAFDSLKQNKKVSGMAHITNANIDITKEHPYLFYIYSCLLFTSKSYVPSLVYSTRALNSYTKDPMIMLTVGLSHIHRSMQRLSANRHLQLLQGLSYIVEYSKLRSINATDYELQEVNFNLGKTYHLIGLFSIAVKYYNKVLEFNNLDEEFDLKVEAAYNLSLIYHIGGNSKLALEITNKYLTI